MITINNELPVVIGVDHGYGNQDRQYLFPDRRDNVGHGADVQKRSANL